MAEYNVIESEWQVRSSDITGFQRDGQEEITEKQTSIKIKSYSVCRHIFS